MRLFCSGDCSQVEVFSRQLCCSSAGSGSWDHAGVENVTQECCWRSRSPQLLELRTISGRNWRFHFSSLLFCIDGCSVLGDINLHTLVGHHVSVQIQHHFAVNGTYFCGKKVHSPFIKSVWCTASHWLDLTMAVRDASCLFLHVLFCIFRLALLRTAENAITCAKWNCSVIAS